MALPERDPNEVMTPDEQAALEHVLDTAQDSDFVEAPRPVFDPVRHLIDQAQVVLRAWSTRFRRPGEPSMLEPYVDFLVSSRTWHEYRLQMLMNGGPFAPPPDLKLFGRDVLISEQVPDGEVRLVVSG